MNHKTETVLNAVRKAYEKYNYRPVSVAEIRVFCKYVIEPMKFRGIMKFLSQTYIKRIDDIYWKPRDEFEQIRKSKTVNEKIMEVIQDFQNIKKIDPTSTQIVERYEVMFGKSPLKDMGRHIRNLATLHEKLRRDNNQRYSIAGEVKQRELGKFLKNSKISS